MEATYWSELRLSRPDGADERGGESLRGRKIGGNLDRYAVRRASRPPVAANVLGTDPDKIEVHLQLLGGGYGRRIWPDAAVQAVRALQCRQEAGEGHPHREDDVAAARPPADDPPRASRPGSMPRARSVGWHHRLVSENVRLGGGAAALQATGGKDYIGKRGTGSGVLRVPKLRLKMVREDEGVRVHAWRGHWGGLQQVCGRNPCSTKWRSRPAMIRWQCGSNSRKNKPRLQAVIKAVVEMADWKRKRPGRGIGIAFFRITRPLSAGVAESRSISASGKIKVHNYWIAVDGG